MKQLLLLFVVLSSLTTITNAATISGRVTSVSTCAAVSGQKVYVSDSFRTWQDSAVTNSNGFYSISIPSSVYSAGFGDIFVSTKACGVVIQRNMSHRVGIDVFCNLIVCGSPSFIRGVVVLGYNWAWPVASRVWLIRRDVNSSTLDTSLTAIDSAFVTSYGYPHPPAFEFHMVCPDSNASYLLKGALLSSDPNYSSYMPSYFDSGLTWNSRPAIPGSSFVTAFPTNYIISLKAGTNPGGPGFIGGSVLLGANKSTGVGDPLINRMLILTTASGKGIGYTYSDASGKFQFNNLPVGTYRIFGDAAGKANPELIVTITSTKLMVNNIIFEENNKKFEGHFSNVGVGKVNALASVHVFPNPVTDLVNIEGLGAINGSKTIVLNNLIGAEMIRQVVTSDAAHIAIATLPAGVYLLQVQTEAGNVSYRIVR